MALYFLLKPWTTDVWTLIKHGYDTCKLPISEAFIRGVLQGLNLELSAHKQSLRVGKQCMQEVRVE